MLKELDSICMGCIQIKKVMSFWIKTETDYCVPSTVNLNSYNRIHIFIAFGIYFLLCFTHFLDITGSWFALLSNSMCSIFIYSS